MQKNLIVMLSLISMSLCADAVEAGLNADFDDIAAELRGSQGALKEGSTQQSLNQRPIDSRTQLDMNTSTYNSRLDR